MKRTALVVLVVVTAGLILRSLRLAWQPIWWDEGYSIYFATEPLARMVWLTARDIHPPLYYALLNLWYGVTGGVAVENSRILSVALGGLALPLMYALARTMFPTRRRTAFVALLLLTFSPIHLYYSQEIRMYGLAVTLGLAATLALWHTVEVGTKSWKWALAYLLASTAALYTLYYAALLLAAHAIWVTFKLRKNLRALAGVVGVYGLLLLLYLPWLAYAVPQLVGYVGSKVQSDQDTPLGPLAYLERHLVAFTAGQVRLEALPAESWALAPATVAICAVILGLVLIQTLRPVQGSQQKADAAVPTPKGAEGTSSGAATAALWTWLAVPMVLGWLINLRLPFFPVGGERLLLITLPYLLLLLAYGIDRTWKVVSLGKVAAGAMAVNALLGIAAFYTTPRYTADDYRPLLRQVVQQGREQDTLLAIFPWQVGYWRAYTGLLAGEFKGQAVTPQPLLLAEGAVEWSPEVRAEIEAALEKGTVWFPEPLTFGSSLPHEIEGYLGENTVNLENRWYEATRLTAWASLPTPVAAPLASGDFGAVRLLAAGIEPTTAGAANTPVTAALVWQGSGLTEANISLRVQDASGHVWSSREYVLTLAGSDGAGSDGAGETLMETQGLIAPYGLPPGGYQVAVSVQTADGEPLTLGGSDAVAAVIGELEVTAPGLGESTPPGNKARLPIQRPLVRPLEADGLRLLGYSGPGADEPLLAGTELGMTLFLGNERSDPVAMDIYLSLLDSAGAGVAGYEGWPLPGYPTAAWLEGALVQVPTAFHLAGSLSSGEYRLVAGFRNPQTGEKSPGAELATVRVVQRPASFVRPTPEYAFAAPPQLGTHVRLLGYDLGQAGEVETRVRLYWEVLQPLLPPHHIFVHLDSAGGQTLAQQDGPPVAVELPGEPAEGTAGNSTGEAGTGLPNNAPGGPAPTGSWQPGEFLTTEHLLQGVPGAGDVVRVGLYDPQTQVRLPVTVDGQGAGDAVAIEPPLHEPQ